MQNMTVFTFSPKYTSWSHSNFDFTIFPQIYIKNLLEWVIIQLEVMNSSPPISQVKFRPTERRRETCDLPPSSGNTFPETQGVCCSAASVELAKDRRVSERHAKLYATPLTVWQRRDARFCPGLIRLSLISH